MQDPNLLSQLHDIQLPDPIGWWPLAFSWWILIFSVTSILVGVLWYYLDLKRRNAYRVTADRLLQTILSDNTLSDYQKISRINRLLKQVALTAYGRSKTAALQSEDWVHFLSDTSSYIPQPENLAEIIEISYMDEHADKSPQIQQATRTLADYAHKWIKGHHQ